MRVAAPRSMKTASPLGQGGTSGGLGVGCPVRPNPSRQPPEGFTNAVVSPSSPFVKGELRPANGPVGIVNDAAWR